MLTSSVTANAVHSLDGTDSILLYCVHLSICVLFSVGHAIDYRHDTVDNLLYAMLVCRVCIPVHAASTRLVNDMITEAVVENVDGAATFRDIASGSLRLFLYLIVSRKALYSCCASTVVLAETVPFRAVLRSTRPARRLQPGSEWM
eukprot:SAG22_NODE_14_length_33165_cov_13.196698_9_plen_146_part_00